MTQKHLKFIDSLPCVVCGRYESTHHHLLRVDREYLTATKETEGLMFPKVKSKGMGTKSDDRFCLPVCPKHHAEAHAFGNDKAYFQKHGIVKPEEFALALWRRSGQYERVMDLMKWHFLGKGKCSELQSSKKLGADKFSQSLHSRVIN